MLTGAIRTAKALNPDQVSRTARPGRPRPLSLTLPPGLKSEPRGLSWDWQPEDRKGLLQRVKEGRVGTSPPG